MRTHVTPPARCASQQTTELRGLAWAVRFAVRTGHKSVTVFSDSEAAIAQVLRLRATSHLTHHQAVLRSLARVLWVSAIVVRLVWVPSALQPGDPMSRVTSVFGGSQARAQVEAWRTWDALLDNLGEARWYVYGDTTPPPPHPQAVQRRQCVRPPCSAFFYAHMTKRRGSRGARKRRGSRGAHRKGRHGGQHHRRSVEAKQRRAAKWTTKLRGRLRGKVAHLPIRRVLLGNGVRLCPQCPLPADRDGFLERAVRDVAARVGGTPHRRPTAAALSPQGSMHAARSGR